MRRAYYIALACIVAAAILTKLYWLHWFPVAATALVAMGFYPMRHRASLAYLSLLGTTHIGHCPKCGYDLRATPDRCPECGTIPPRKKKNSN